MPWLFLLLALGAFAVALKASSSALVVVALLAALVFMVAWMLGLLAQRVGSRTRDDAMILDPQELRRLREQAEARRASSGPTGAPSAEPPQS